MRAWTGAAECSRRGIAIVWLLVTLTILTALMGAVTWQQLAGRRWADRRQRDLQADWLARGGVELAAERLLAENKEFSETSTSFLAGSELRISVRAERDPAVKGNRFLVTSEVRYRADDPPPVVRSLSRYFRRNAEGNGVRVEPLQVPSPAAR